MINKFTAQPFTNKNKIIVLITIVIVIIVLSVVFRKTIKTEILIPLYFFGWGMLYLFKSVPQIIYWELFVLLGAVIAFQSITYVRKSVHRNIADQEENSMRFSGKNKTKSNKIENHTSRYHFWEHTIQKLEFNTLSPGTVSLRRLILEILAYQLNLTPEEAEKHVLNGTADIPEEIAVFVLTRNLSTEKQKSLSINCFSKASQLLTRMIHNLFYRRTPESVHSGANPKSSPNQMIDSKEQHLEKIIQYLEKQLEIHHDTRQN